MISPPWGSAGVKRRGTEAASRITASSPAPTPPDTVSRRRGAELLLVPDARVNKRIEKVHHAVDQGKQQGEDQDRSLHHGKVSLADRLHHEPAHPRPAVNSFGHDRPTQCRAELKAHNSHDREQRIAQGVASEHDPLALAFRPSRAHIILLQDLKQCPPCDATEQGEVESASIRLVNTGPDRNTNSAVRAS